MKVEVKQSELIVRCGNNSYDHRVAFSEMRLTDDDQILTWLKECSIKCYRYSRKLYFTDEATAILFALRWA